MRLIDYTEIRKLFDEEYKKTAQLIRDGETHLNNLAEGYVGADKVIRSLPDVDAVEVVRCKDCESCNIYYPRKDIGKEPEPAYYCESFECYTKPTDFCSDGERKCEE